MSPLPVAAVLAAGIAAITDLRSGRIPNRLTLAAFALGVTGHVLPAFLEGNVDAVWRAFASTLVGATLGGVVPILLWRAGALGGGDVKLFIAIGALLGPMLGLEAQLMSFACAALVVPLQLVRQGQLLSTLRRSAGVVVHTFKPTTPLDTSAMTWVRLGPAIFGGTLLAVLSRA
jgi:prepilin peptidase CpaA